jgi:hypothetical protein
MYPSGGDWQMNIRCLLNDSGLEPPKQQLLHLAYRRTLTVLQLVNRDDPICEIVARKIIEVSERGTTNAIAISEITIRELGNARDASP